MILKCASGNRIMGCWLMELMSCEVQLVKHFRCAIQKPYVHFKVAPDEIHVAFDSSLHKDRSLN